MTTSTDRRDYFRQWNKDHAEERRAYMRSYYANNKEKWAPHNARPKRLMRRYRLTEEEFDAMLEHQGGACAICRTDGQPLVVDHDHSTGLVRGLLCHPCNLGIGKFKNDPSLLDAAARYLRPEHG